MRGGAAVRVEEEEFCLQWGSRKRMRCVRVRGGGGGNTNFAQASSSSNDISSSSSSRNRNRNKMIRRRITSTRFLTLPPPTSSHHMIRNSETETVRSEIRKSWSCSPEKEKEERYYSTRGGGGGGGGGGGSIVVGLEANEKITVDGVGGKQQGGDHHQNNNNIKKMDWPKVCIGLSSKEKEEDFMAMKGCKLPHRPKKRPKIIQRTLLQKGRGGLKGMGSSSGIMYNSDSE
ncbi:hypothetical protein BUALT_Bualt16G0129700 [Buddleja alternifolia]|uniref:Uncharacterized protein n=1 Tax=Buddleja alternifolia TaxID=168488 RepID=A0AAV6WBX3_9LAMI|nr:hypothetical protein BUALT_Bualt16G0129700 [Buddleja alternifolia]